MPDHHGGQEGVAFLLYDADCGPCTRFRNVVARLDVRHRLVPIPLQSAAAYNLVRSRMTRAEMMQAFHVVYRKSSLEPAEERNSIFDAGDALIELLRLLPLGSYAYWVLSHFKPSRRLIRWLYSLMAQLRTISISCKVSS